MLTGMAMARYVGINGKQFAAWNITIFCWFFIASKWDVGGIFHPDMLVSGARYHFSHSGNC